MSDFTPRAIEECPGWVETDPCGFFRASEIDNVSAYPDNFDEGDQSSFSLRSIEDGRGDIGCVGTAADLLKAIAAAQRLEWKAKRAAELEAEREAPGTSLTTTVSALPSFDPRGCLPAPSAWGPLERLPEEPWHRYILERYCGTLSVIRRNYSSNPGCEYAEIPQ